MVLQSNTTKSTAITILISESKYSSAAPFFLFFLERILALANNVNDRGTAQNGKVRISTNKRFFMNYLAPKKIPYVLNGFPEVFHGTGKGNADISGSPKNLTRNHCHMSVLKKHFRKMKAVLNVCTLFF